MPTFQPSAMPAPFAAPAPFLPPSTDRHGTADSRGAAGSAGPEGGPFLSSDDLLQGCKAVTIAHNGFVYRLQATRLGKLILTK